MSLLFLVQVETAGKWKAVYRGDDPYKAAHAYRAAISEVGSDKVRCLKSDSEKEDGTLRWVLTKVPAALDDGAEQDDDFDIVRDWFGTPAKAVGTLLFFGFAIFLTVEFFAGKPDATTPASRPKSVAAIAPPPKVPAKPVLPLLEQQLENYVRAGGPTDLNSVEGMRQVSAYMNILSPQFNGGIFGAVGAEIETLKTETVEAGMVPFSGRTLPAGIVQATATVVNRSAGKRFRVCIRMGGAVDESFRVVRSIAFFDCTQSSAARAEWAGKYQYKRQN